MTHVFWQYPVITEKICYMQNHKNEKYIGFPWATIIDSKMNLSYLKSSLEQKIVNKENNITCCQHILFRILIPIFKSIGISILYTPHKIIGEDFIDGIRIKPCPLYAVNIEDSTRNSTFLNVDFENIPRKYLYSFQGAYQNGYLSLIRKDIFKLPEKDDVFIKSIGGWHFNEIVYSKKNQNLNENTIDVSHDHINNTLTYNQILLQSVFSLSPSGSGPNSIRFWECLAIGTIPVLLSDKLELPTHSLWSKSIIRLKESEINTVDEVLRKYSVEQISTMRKNCIKIYNDFRNKFLQS